MRVSLDKIHAKSIVDGSEKTVNWPLWELVITDVDSAVKKHGQAIAATILETGVPVIIRGIVWQCLAKSMDMSLATRFGELAAQRQPRIEQAIIADIQAHRLAEIRGVNIDAVVSVLTAYFAYDSHCDYVPGLASITAVLTLHLNPVDAFCLLVRLMVTYDLRSHLHPRSEKTQLRLHQFDRLLEESLPLVQRHFIQEGIPSSAFVPGWFAALFATHLPLPAAARIVDIILAEGIEGLFRFALTLLRVNQQRVFSHSFDNLRAFITGPEIFDVYTSASPPVDILQFIVDSTTQQSNLITVPRLDSLSAEFDLRRAREQQEQTQLEQLKLINAQLDQANKKLQSNLQQLNQEHCDLANQLVQIRLELIREREVSTKYQQRTTDLEQQVLVEREKAEESMRNDMDALAHRNIELAEKAMKLEGDMIDVQDALISVKLKYAESEQMREDLNRRFKELRRALGHN
ncbi:RabGAP/TBC [Ramicandelaber brevisporus]|nr:RabGAP/TBC [Ramicandelaber brevisporus]